MKILNFSDEQAWLNARLGKITGTRLKDIIVKRGTAKKIGFWELVAEKIATRPDSENRMNRGKRLEDEALDRFEKETGRKVNRDLVLWERDEDTNIAVSPDGTLVDTPIPNSEAVECKCLSSARHIEAFWNREIPDEYQDQVKQYFIVNDLLTRLFMVFYDPRMSVKDYFVIEVTRPEVQKDVDELLNYQRTQLKEVEQIVLKLMDF